MLRHRVDDTDLRARPNGGTRIGVVSGSMGRRIPDTWLDV